MDDSHGLELPPDLLAYLQSDAPKSFDFKAVRRTYDSALHLLPLSELRREDLEVRPEISPFASESPNTGPGYFAVPGVNLTRGDPDGEAVPPPTYWFVWLPTESRYGTWDTEHNDLIVFRPEVNWAMIVAELPKYFRATNSGEVDEELAEYFCPWPKYPFVVPTESDGGDAESILEMVEQIGVIGQLRKEIDNTTLLLKSHLLIELYSAEDWPNLEQGAGELLEMAPGNLLALKLRCYARHSTENISGALADAEELVRLDPSEDHHYDLRASLRSDAGLHRLAIEDYLILLERDSNSVSARNGIAGIWANSPDETLRDGTKAVEWSVRVNEETEYANHHYIDTLASAYAECGNFENAIRFQQRCIEAIPDGEDRSEFEERLSLYRSGRPFRNVAPE